MILVTGGAGFIGANFVLDWLAGSDEPVVNLDKLTYAGNMETLAPLKGDPRHIFVKGDIGDSALVATCWPRTSRAPSSISRPSRTWTGPFRTPKNSSRPTSSAPFACSRPRASSGRPAGREKNAFRFLQVSTDEVYGSLRPADPAFSETHRYEPNSPYSASKAASDHLTRAYHHTYGLPVLTTNCSNNYGPYHFPEKLIPLMIVNALAGKPLPVYGDGQQVRDWLYVKDHCSGIRRVLEAGKARRDLQHRRQQRKTEYRHRPCGVRLLDELRPRAGGSYREQVAFIKDRPGHDRRYAIDASKMTQELGWKPAETFEPASARPCSGTWTTLNGSPMCKAALTATG
jgi:dTDP-glucose 4,6-dehydratase